MIPVIDEVLRDNGLIPTATENMLEAEFPAPAAAEGTGKTESTQTSEVLSARADALLPPPRVATAGELFSWTKRSLLEQSHLPEDAAELVTFWVISSYFQEVMTILPCLVLTGTAHDAGTVLHVLGDFCRKTALLAGFRRRDLGVLRGGYETILISEPNIDMRTANFFGSLTDRRFLFVEGRLLTHHSKLTAIYAGENPEPPRIQNSIHIHIAPANAAPRVRPPWLQEMIARLPVHLDQYRNKNLNYVRNWKWVPSGLFSESASIATALGRGIVDAPELRQKLVVLIKSQDQQRLSEMSNTTEAIVLEATQTLSCDGREHAYVKEIAAEANRRLEARGETVRLSPEKAGHKLKKLGLRTRPLSQTGRGLTFDKVTLARIQQLAVVYMMEDAPTERENLHISQTEENN